MAAIKFELKQEHLDLLKHLDWSSEDNTYILRSSSTREPQKLYNEDDVLDGVSLILEGKYTMGDPLEQDEANTYPQEVKDRYYKLLSELPTALNIILNIGSFELGMYKTRSYLNEWKKII